MRFGADVEVEPSRGDDPIPPAAEPGRGARWRGLVPVLWTVALTVVVLGPLTGRGWVLQLDWVTGPRMATWSRVGDAGSLPAGPLFFSLVAVVEALAGAAVGWLVPAAVLVLAGTGAARLAPWGTPAALAAATAAVWNPFVHERIYAGQYAVLLGYGLLPWLLTALRAGWSSAAAPPTGDHGDGATRPRRGAGARAGVWWALAGMSSVHLLPIGAVVVWGLPLLALLRPRRRAPAVPGDPAVDGAPGGPSGSGPDVPATRADGAPGVAGRRALLEVAAVATAVATLVTAAWLLPIVGAAQSPGDRSTVEAFATRADPSLGLALGTLAQRGFWRTSPGEPGSSLGAWWAPVVLVLAGVAIAALVRARRHRCGGTALLASAALAAGAVGWIASWGTSGPFGPLYAAALTWLPGFGTMREAGKFLALVSLATAAGLGLAVDALTTAARRAGTTGGGSRAGAVALGAVVVGLVALPITSTPGLAWGVDGRLGPSRFPPEWAEVRAVLDAEPWGRTMVLPWNAYLDPGFTGTRIVRNPARVYFGPVAWISDDPKIPGLRGSPEAVAAEQALWSPRAAETLASLGVGRVLAVGPVPAITAPQFRLEYESGSVRLYRIDVRPAA